MTRPVRLKSHKVVIEAPRELVYQMMSSFGWGRLTSDDHESSRVLRRRDDSIIDEFRSRAGPLTVTTTEKVQLAPSERITFHHLRGPLRCAREEFLFRNVDGGTELEHYGEFMWSRLPPLADLWGDS